jgi:hypothetical protein
MAQLDDGDRNALVLRFFDRCDFKSVGAALGISDDAAQKRVSRALDRLRGLLARRGATHRSASSVTWWRCKSTAAHFHAFRKAAVPGHLIITGRIRPAAG